MVVGGGACPRRGVWDEVGVLGDDRVDVAPGAEVGALGIGLVGGDDELDAEAAELLRSAGARSGVPFSGGGEAREGSARRCRFAASVGAARRRLAPQRPGRPSWASRPQPCARESADMQTLEQELAFCGGPLSRRYESSRFISGASFRMERVSSKAAPLEALVRALVVPLPEESLGLLSILLASAAPCGVEGRGRYEASMEF